jgi:hypothetical protein
MKLEVGLKKEIEKNILLEVLFSGSYEQGNTIALKELCENLKTIIQEQKPSAVLLNLLDFDYIYGNDLKALIHTATFNEELKTFIQCAIVAEGRKVATSGTMLVTRSGEIGVLLEFFHDREQALRYVEEKLRIRLAEPKGNRPGYFPDLSLADELWEHNFYSSWFSRHLWVMQEPSLLKLAQDNTYHGYRFLWLRTFHQPVSVRLEIHPSGSGILTAKMTSGAGGYDPGELIINDLLEVPTRDVKIFLGYLDKVQFWQNKEHADASGLDGAQWIIEGVKAQIYHVINRWCPNEKSFRDLALYLIELGHLKIDNVY